MNSSSDSDEPRKPIVSRHSRRAQPARKAETNNSSRPARQSRKLAKFNDADSDDDDDDDDDDDHKVHQNGKTVTSKSNSLNEKTKLPSLKIKKIDKTYKSLISDKKVVLEKRDSASKKSSQPKKENASKLVKGKKSASNGYDDSKDKKGSKRKDTNGYDSDTDEEDGNTKTEDMEELESSECEVITAKSTRGKKEKEGKTEDVEELESSECEVVASKSTRGKKGKVAYDSDVDLKDLEGESSGTDAYVPVKDSDDDVRKQGKKGKGTVVLSSEGEDSDVKKKTRNTRRGKRKKESDESKSEDSDLETKKKGKGKGSKRRRIKKMSSSEAGSDAQGSGEEDGKTRKKIRKIIKDKKLSKEVKSAVKAEEERRDRVKERQKLYNQITEVDINSPMKSNITTKLVLDVDDKKEPLIEVHPKLIRKLKPHQVEAVKFMWDCSVESLERMKEEDGAGCILAHCMGLGKTLSLITFAHTLLYNEDVTNIKTCLVVSPLNTVLNWQNEWTKWFEEEGQLDIYELSTVKDSMGRARELDEWHKNGGVMIIGYEMYRNLVLQKNIKKKKLKETFTRCLSDPGPDLVVCDEGHMLKNSATSTSKAMSQIKTKRRIVLTGTPLQNNLAEYHCMVDFVKPKLLGTKKEFLNRFVNPILNGQCADSSAQDVKLMKKRAHILHETLAGCVQRKDYTELTKVLMPLHEYVLSVRLSPVQQELYDKYMEMQEDEAATKPKGAQLFSDYQALMRIWTHPWVLKLDEIRQEHKRMMNDEFDDEFIDDENEYDENESVLASSSLSSSSSSSASESDDSTPKKKKKTGRKSDSDSERSVKRSRGTKRTRKMRGEASEEDEQSEESEGEKKLTDEWWGDFVSDEDQYKHELSGKILLLAEVLRMCENIGDKLLVFSQSLLSLDLIESFLEYWDSESDPDKRVGGQHRWVRNIDYYRMDGSTSAQGRKSSSEDFNDEENHRGRLFLISTRAGSLGTNLVAANRVIIFDASWNPSHDIQSIFRVYRFGQTKPCYIYRFLAQGTMEEKIYERQVTKQSLSQRVVDEHQIERHFNAQDLQELYRFTPLRWTSENEERETPALPTDRLLAELLTDKKDWIVKYHTHDSLLENKVDEDLTEEERKAAWEEYEAEKKGVLTATRNTYANQVNQMNQMSLQQQQQQLYNYYGMQQQQQQPQQPSMSLQSIEQVARAIYAANPGITQTQLQLKVQDYIEMVTAQQRHWFQQQQPSAMGFHQGGGAGAALAAAASKGGATAAAAGGDQGRTKAKPSTSTSVIDLIDSDKDEDQEDRKEKKEKDENEKKGKDQEEKKGKDEEEKKETDENEKKGKDQEEKKGKDEEEKKETDEKEKKDEEEKKEKDEEKNGKDNKEKEKDEK